MRKVLLLFVAALFTVSCNNCTSVHHKAIVRDVKYIEAFHGLRPQTLYSSTGTHTILVPYSIPEYWIATSSYVYNDSIYIVESKSHNEVFVGDTIDYVTYEHN